MIVKEKNSVVRGFMLVVTLIICISPLSMISQNRKTEPLDFTEKAMSVAAVHLENMLPKVLDAKKLPRSIERGLKPAKDWTSGFYPGSLWFMYEYTGDKKWKKAATKVTKFLKKQQYNEKDHDIGFRIYCSYGAGYRLTGNNRFKKTVVRAAKSLTTRFDSKIGVIQSWDLETMPARGWHFPVIIDNMMNLELLFAATKFTGDSTYYKIAVTHADTTMRYHYREDMSCPHVVDYNPETGRFIKMDFNNGYSPTSAWSRGQGWSIYGYTMTYRETKDEKYLNHAEKVAEFILNHPNMPTDMVPYWDFSAPKIPTHRDASAAAIICSALFELSEISDNGNRYFIAAEKMLKSLASEEYLAKPGTNGDYLIKHCTGNHRKNSEVDGTLSYADYYFIEAIMRYKKIIESKK